MSSINQLNQLSEAPCPCFSGKGYKECCAPFHQGELPGDAVKLMRSRFSAYALSLVDYIISTTHPNHPRPKTEELFRQDILSFCQETQFLGLTIEAFDQQEETASVTFAAFLQRRGQNCSFLEKSQFLKQEGRWLYLKPLIMRPLPL